MYSSEINLLTYLLYVLVPLGFESRYYYYPEHHSKIGPCSAKNHTCNIIVQYPCHARTKIEKVIVLIIFSFAIRTAQQCMAVPMTVCFPATVT